MPDKTENARGLTAAQIETFIRDGFVRVDNAFSAQTAAAAREILWRELSRGFGCEADDPSTWRKPVIRLGGYADPPFVAAANTPLLLRAFDQLAGPGTWQPSLGMGTFPVRFPSTEDPGDTGWHIDVSFGLENPDFLEWRANIGSRGRRLLMLFLFSDIGERDAPTRIVAGSHSDIARRLAPAGEAGLTLREISATGFAESAHRRQVLATGRAGTVYLCHPFLVHAAQPNRGRTARFLAQPALHPREGVEPDGSAPVEQAIARALTR